MKTGLDMDDRAFGFDPPERREPGRHLARASREWAVPARRFARMGPVLPRPASENLLRLLEPRRRHDWALLAVIRDAYVGGGATRRVEAAAHILGVDGINDEDVEHAGHELDRQVQAFRTRPVPHAYPYLVIDTILEKVRDHGRVPSLAAIIVAGIAASGDREVLALEVEDPADPLAWPRILSDLRDRGVYGVRLVTSEPYPTIHQAIAETFPAATWQRSRSGLHRELLEAVAEPDRPELAALVRDVFVQEDRASALEALRRICLRFPSNRSLADHLRAQEESILAFYDFPVWHRRRINATTCLARARGEIQRHCRLIGIFPSRQTLLRLSGVMLQEHNDEWMAGPRYFGRRDDGRRRMSQNAWLGPESDAATTGAPALFRLVQAA